MPDFPYITEDETVRVPDNLTQHIACCDCGLVHRFEFKIRKRGRKLFLYWKTHREVEMTAELREKDNERAREASIGAELPAGFIEKMGLTDGV